MFQNLAKDLFKGRRNKTKSIPCKIKLNLETLEDRVVPSYVWAPSSTAADTRNYLSKVSEMRGSWAIKE